MRISAFLLGGLVGAAAVVYLSNRNKSMFGAALSSSDSANQWMNMATEQSNKPANSKSNASASHAFQSGSKETGNKSPNVLNDNLFKEDGLNKVSDIVNRDPGLKAAVDDILGGSGEKAQQTH